MMKNRFLNEAEQKAYESACDCIYYGYGALGWNNYGIGKDRKNVI